jgi:2-amino-4-hydroxy-6-hydroxymethyldihydropteridine diphosphokinase
MKYHTAYLSIGSNLGDKQLNCQKGIEALAGLKNTFLEKKSPFYKTEPLDYTDQQWFINCAVKIKTVLEPFELLDALQSIEKYTGRKDGAVRFGPRVLDLDIIFFDNIELHSSRLIIPHPRMHNRCFVLKPLYDINPKMVHPVMKQNIETLLKSIDEHKQKVYPVSCV